MADTIVSTNQSLSGYRVAAGDRYIFDPTKDVTVTINVNYSNFVQPANNFIVEGTLQMRPNPGKTHILQFLGIDVTRFIGGPHLGAFILECWFKRTGAGVGTSTGTGGLASAIPLISKGRGVGLNYFLGIDAATGALCADFTEGAMGTTPGLHHPLIGTTAVTSDVWHHAAVTYDGSVLRLYLDIRANPLAGQDGQPAFLGDEGSVTVGQPPPSDATSPASIGSALNTAGVAAGFFQGDVDEVRIWGATEANSNPVGNTGNPGARYFIEKKLVAKRDIEATPAPSLLGLWHMNAVSGSVVTDSSWYANTGTTVGSPSWTTGPPLPGATGALSLNGSSQYVNLGTSPTLRTHDMMNPQTTDPGVWIIMDGVLDIEGTPRVAWNRTGTDPSWAPGDEIRAVPWDGTKTTVDLTSTPIFTPGVTPVKTFVTCDGVTQYQEICNLQRNVIIRGALNAESHLMMMSTQPQNIRYATFEFMGPKDTSFSEVEQRDVNGLILARWALHFHRMFDASYGSEVFGVVSRGGRGRSFVTHRSNGVHYYECLSWFQAGFWYDQEETAAFKLDNAPGDLTYERCGIVGGGQFVLDSVQFNNRNHIFECFAAGFPETGVHGSGAPGSHDWPNKSFVGWSGRDTPDNKGQAGAGGNIWDHRDNVVHNSGSLGISIWQNEANKHAIRRARIFKILWPTATPPPSPQNGHGVTNAGAYRTAYDFTDSTFDDPVWDAAAAHSTSADNELTQYDIKTMPGRNWIRCHFNGLFLGQHVQPSIVPTRLLECTFHAFIDATDSKPQSGDNNRNYDIIRCNAGPPSMDVAGEDWLTFGTLMLASQYRFQDVDGNAFRLDHPTTAAPTKPYTFVPIARFALHISTSSLTVATQGSAYSKQLDALLGEATGQYGTAIRQWTLAPDSGPLPPGLALSLGGLISGTPTTAGSYPIKVRVEDTKNVTADRAFTLVVGVLANPLQITTTSLDGGIIGTPYPTAAGKNPIVATGGTAPRTFALAPGSGPLPPGLSLSSAGLISGTPTMAAPSYPFTVRVTDAVAAFDDQALSIAVVDLNPSFLTTSLNAGELNLGYSMSVVAQGGTPGYTFSLELGPLPPGLTLSAAGAITGTPTSLADSPYPVRLRVTDSAGRFALRDYSITIYPQLQLLSPALTNGVVGQTYADEVTATGGAPPVTFTVFPPETLPPGISISTEGQFSGTPTTAGNYSMVVDVHDGLGATDSKAAFITVVAAPAVLSVVADEPNAFTVRRSRVRERV